MAEFFTMLLIIGGVFALSFIMINIRHIVTGNEFRGTCASNNPLLKNELGECSMCGKKPDEECKMPDVAKA
jgi:hypothetical protein